MGLIVVRMILRIFFGLRFVYKFLNIVQNKIFLFLVCLRHNTYDERT
jgi:hypothetical protein